MMYDPQEVSFATGVFCGFSLGCIIMDVTYGFPMSMPLVVALTVISWFVTIGICYWNRSRNNSNGDFGCYRRTTILPLTIIE